MSATKRRTSDPVSMKDKPSEKSGDATESDSLLYKPPANRGLPAIDWSRRALSLAIMLPVFALILLSTYVFRLTTTASDVGGFISKESSIAKAGILANIGPNGSKSSGAKAGVVIASPSKVDPDYLFTWTRDSSLVFKALIDQYTNGIDTSSSLRTLIDEFAATEAHLQQVSNPSGNISTGGLGEPKFNIDETAFTGNWGRPQRDGPALRSTALITYANWLIDNGNSSYVTSALWPTIQLDLNYVAGNWNLSTFDLWEEVESSSFFTTAVQHRSLREGAILAKSLGYDSDASNYEDQAGNLLCFLQSYWNPASLYITANTGGGRSGKDSNTVLASIHTFDPEAGCDVITFQPCSDAALSNLFVYVNAFRSIYTINSGIPAYAAVATGRYPEDVYYNGNPWYLTTLAAAEQLYDALMVWNSTGAINVTTISQAFFQQFDSSIAVGSYEKSTSTFKTLVSGVQTLADGFINIVAKYTPSDGGLAEQINKTTGVPVSAVDLTWSYASALTAFQARSGFAAASWGAKGLSLPSGCSSRVNASNVPVTFNVEANTVFGENIYITGSVAQLSNWSTSSAILLSGANYPEWSVSLSLPANTTIEYKYIRIFLGHVTWESGPNNKITTPANGTFTTNDAWH